MTYFSSLANFVSIKIAENVEIIILKNRAAELQEIDPSIFLHFKTIYHFGVSPIHGRRQFYVIHASEQSLILSLCNIVLAAVGVVISVGHVYHMLLVLFGVASDFNGGLMLVI